MEDWPRPQWRDLIRAVLGVAIAVVVLAVFGFPGEVLAEVGIVGGSAIALLILPSAGQLWWAWFKAPTRLLTSDVRALTDDLRAIREKLEGLSLPAEEHRDPTTTTLVLRNQVRLGRELLKTSASGMTERRLIREWLDGVVEELGHAIPEDIEGVLSKHGVEEQVAELEAVAERQTLYRTRATITAGGRRTG